jgi:hypothetical protein
MTPSFPSQNPGLMFDAMIDALENGLRIAVKSAVTGLVATARAHANAIAAEIVEKRVKGLAEIADERAKGLEVDARRAELHREVAAMQTHQIAHEGRVELNIGGFRFETLVQTLRRVPHTFFDAYFSGRYAQDVCADGSIFVDRNGEHFGYFLEYMRDGVVSVAEPGARTSVSLLRALKREFGFYCIELCAEQPIAPHQPAEEIYVTGGFTTAQGRPVSSVERYTPSSDSWSTVAPLPSAVYQHAAVAVGSAKYVLGGTEQFGGSALASVYKFDSTQGTWSAVEPLPEPRHLHAACAIGSDIYVFGGRCELERKTSVLKYDTKTGTWSTLEPMPLPCSYFSVSLFYSDQVYFVGAGDDGKGFLCFNAASSVWSTLGATANSKHGSASFVVDELLYVAGGLHYSTKVERYDAYTDTWTRAQNNY